MIAFHYTFSCFVLDALRLERLVRPLVIESLTYSHKLAQFYLLAFPGGHLCQSPQQHAVLMIRSTRLLLQILLHVHLHSIDLKPVLRGVIVIFLSVFFLILSWLDVPHSVCISCH